MINPKIINPLIKDYVIEQGSINGWNYRKWNSGKAEAFREYTTNIAIQTQSGSIYRSGGNTLMIPSSVFIGTPQVYGQVRGTFCWIANITIAKAGTDFTFYLANGSSTTSASRTMNFMIYGNWK